MREVCLYCTICHILLSFTSCAAQRAKRGRQNSDSRAPEIEFKILLFAAITPTSFSSRALHARRAGAPSAHSPVARFRSEQDASRDLNYVSAIDSQRLPRPSSAPDTPGDLPGAARARFAASRAKLRWRIIFQRGCNSSDARLPRQGSVRSLLSPRAASVQLADQWFSPAAATSISRPATAAPVATTRAAAAVGSVGAAYTDTDTAIAPTTPPTGVVLTTRANSLYSESFAAVASTSFVPTQTAIANPNASNGNSNSNPTSGSSAAADSGSQPILTRPALYGIIGGGSALVAILLGVIAWWFWRKKRAIKEERSWWKLNEAGQSPDGKSGGRSAIDRDPGYLAGEGSRSFSREKGDDGQGMESESTRFGAGAASGRPQFSSKKSDPSVRSQSTYYQQAPGPVTAAATRAELFAPAAPVRRDQNHVNDVITFGGDDTQPRYPPSPPRQAPQGAAPVTHAYSSGPSSNRPFSTKDLPPLRPNFRPTQAPQNSRSQAPPPTQRLLEAPLNGEQYSRAGIPLPTPSRSESLAPDSRSRAYGGGVVDPLSRHEERNRERREMERLRSAPSPESNAGINGAQSAWGEYLAISSG